MARNHVVVTIHPFIMRQEVSAYVDGVCVKHAECQMDEMDKICYAFCKEFDIHQIDLVGVTKFCEQIENKMLTKQEYANFDLNFNYY